MQNSYFSNKPTQPRFLVLAVVIFIGLLTLVLITKNDQEITVATSEAKSYKPETSDSVSYQVSGLVEPSDSLTLYAKRPGYVRQINVVEGDEVESGMKLLLAVDPTTEAKLGVQEVAGAINILKAQSGLLEVSQKKQLAEIGYGESVALAAITGPGGEVAATASLKQLESILREVSIVVPQALRFVEENKPLFTAESMNIYDEVVKGFYGTKPNYLQSGLVRGGTGADLFALATNAPSTDLVEVSKLVNAELLRLLDLYQYSESEFFDEDELASDTVELAAYLELRSGVASLSSALVGAANSASTAIDGAEITDIRNISGTTTAEVTLDTAKALADIIAQIEGRTSDLSAAELRVLTTELGLGLTQAPFAGVVMEVMVEEGRYVNAGEPLVRLSGNEAKEMKVKLTGVGTGVKVGDSFLADGKTVGVVDRVVPILEAGSVTTFISITDADIKTGSVVSGFIAVKPLSGQQVIGRDYLQFDQVGPYVVTKAGDKIRLAIIYDQAESLVVEGEREINEELTPTYGVRL